MNEYEEAISHLEQILSVFANQLDTCQRFGKDVDECNENVAATLQNIGIVQILNGKFEDATVQFTRATDILQNSLNKTNDFDLIVRSELMPSLFHIAFIKDLTLYTNFSHLLSSRQQ